MPCSISRYTDIEWEKHYKIGKAIKEGKFALVYSIAWEMATKGAGNIKKVVLDKLGLEEKNV